MPYEDLREFMRALERAGELRRIKTPVSCELEITEITDFGAAHADGFGR